MNNSAAAIADTGAIPIVLPVKETCCFGWFHPAGSPKRGVGVVLCRPIGYESICAYGAYTQLAEALARIGFDVLRFDYHGTGDSAGDDTDPERVDAWTDSIISAAQELKRLAGVAELALLGVRMGATLAVRAALQLGGVQSLVMWAPCIKGRGFVRELRAASAAHARSATNADSRDIEALGYFYSAETIQDLSEMDCSRLDAAPAKSVLILGRDDMPGEGSLPAKYREMGMDTSYAVVPGYAAMMAEPRETKLPDTTLALITDWFAAAHPLPAEFLQVAQSEPLTTGYIQNGIHEMPLRFGPDSLFGMLTGPAGLPAESERSQTAILMLNVGGNYRIGPGRIYVKMARSLAALGYRALRFDLAGIGDSRTGINFSFDSLYSRDSTAEVRAAIDCLAAKGCRKFYLLGICSGSFVAFQTALGDPRVTGQILMNSRLLEWRDEKDAGSWQNSMQRYYKSTDFYRRALFRPELYVRLIRGQVDVKGISRRFGEVVKARLKRTFHELMQRTPVSEDDPLAKVRRLAARGTHTLLIVGAQDDGRDYLEFHFGKLGSRMQNNPYFRMVVVEESDHTFSGLDSQQFVIAIVHTHLEHIVALDAQEQALAVCSAANGPATVQPRAVYAAESTAVPKVLMESHPMQPTVPSCRQS
jgi:alpha-beta hydrolase superfamily lysophospholipase